MPRNEKEMIQQNIELSAEFSRYLFEHSDIEESIPPDSEVILLPEFNPELKSFNLELGKKLESTGTKVVYIKIEKLRPKILSRMEGVRVELEASG